MKTHYLSLPEIKKQWLLVDATGLTVGRLSTEIARRLRGKHKACFVPHWDCGDNVVVINAEKVKFTGKKWADKEYHWHTSYIGGIKGRTAAQVRDAHPDRIIKEAVKGMLPHNKLGRKIIKNLKIYSGAAHPHESQKPVPMPPRMGK